MRAGLLAGAVLCSLALLGLIPLRALAADPPSSGAAPATPATAVAVEHATSTATQQDASAPQDTSAKHDASTPQATSARQAHAASDQPQRAMSRPQGRRERAGPPLDLAAPPFTRVMTPEQVQALIAEPDEEPEEVMVQEGRYEAPVPQGQIRALAWALAHPLQAWRIFTPVTDQ